MSQTCQQRNSFDHLVGAGEDCWRQLDAQRFGDAEVDPKIELGGTFERQVARLCAFQNAIKLRDQVTKSRPFFMYSKVCWAECLRGPTSMVIVGHDWGAPVAWPLHSTILGCLIGEPLFKDE